MCSQSSSCRASGHVDRFLDYMVKDVKAGDCFRVDHLIKANLEDVLKDKKASEDDKKEARDLLGKVGCSKSTISSRFHIG